MRFSIHEWKIYLTIFKNFSDKKAQYYGKNEEKATTAKPSSRPCANLTTSVVIEVSAKMYYAATSASAPRLTPHSFEANAIGWTYS